MEVGEGTGVAGEASPGHGVLKHEKPAVTRARALVESAKRTKKVNDCHYVYILIYLFW